MLVSGGFLAWVVVRRFRHTGFPSLSTFAASALAGVAVVMLLAAFIAPRKLFPGPAPYSAASATARPASTAHLSILKPVNGQHVSGSELEVVMKLTGGTIVQTTTTNIAPDTGHIHLSVDGRLVSMTYGVLQPIDLSSLKPGTHTLTAQFVAADHGPFNPPVVATATFSKDG